VARGVFKRGLRPLFFYNKFPLSLNKERGTGGEVTYKF
jgi:hypothetical protein